MPCPQVPVDLYHWFLNHFDPSYSSLRLPNGFSFQITNKVVHQFFGIPIGPKLIHPEGILESFWFFKIEFNWTRPTPSMSELCKLITPELVRDRFIRCFMLLALSAFLCPNTRSVCSCRYYPALIDVTMIKNLNWSSFVLEWFLSYAIKYKKSQGNSLSRTSEVCSHLLVVKSYHQFFNYMTWPTFISNFTFLLSFY